VSSEGVWFVAERFEGLRATLEGRGYGLDPGARDPSGWEDLVLEDPPLGMVRMKAIRLVDPEDPDSDFDPEISLSVEEYWTTEPAEDAIRIREFWLSSYSYHGHAHDLDMRYDFDPLGHPEMPYHFHPPASNERRPTEQQSFDEVLDDFEYRLLLQQLDS
jgi:hypothetical protein